MGAHSFEDLKNHIGHKIVCVGYGNPIANVAVECETCGEVLLDFDQGIVNDWTDKTTVDVDRLVKMAEEHNISESSLDDLIHDVANAESANVNNGGIRAQIEYIIKQCGEEGAKQIEQIFKEEIDGNQGT